MSESVVAIESYSVWVPVIAALSGVFVAGVLSLISNILLGGWQRKSEAKSLRLALGAEIKAIVTVIRARGYEDDLLSIIQNMNAQNIKKKSFSIKVADNFAPIFNANTDKVGLLKPGEAAFIVGFHQLILSIVQDVTPGGVIYKGADRDALIELSGLLDKAVRMGEQIYKHIEIPTELKK